MKLISIIAPMYNEEELVQDYCNAVVNTLSYLDPMIEWEIILVDDGSVDSTYAKMVLEQQINMHHISIVKLTRNFGLEGAVFAGLSCVRGDAAIVMDADLQDPPETILTMIDRWKEGNLVVNGIRSKREHDTPFKKITAGGYYWLLDKLSGKMKIDRNAANYKLLDRRVIDTVLKNKGLNASFRVIVPMVGYPTTSVLYERKAREKGATKYGIAKMIRYALDSLTGISIEPLRKSILLVPLYLLIGAIAFLATIWAPTEIFSTLITIGAISTFFALLMLPIVVISEYIGQIHIEVAKRPQYLIEDFAPSSAAKLNMENDQ